MRTKTERRSRITSQPLSHSQTKRGEGEGVSERQTDIIIAQKRKESVYSTSMIDGLFIQKKNQ